MTVNATVSRVYLSEHHSHSPVIPVWNAKAAEGRRWNADTVREMLGRGQGGLYGSGRGGAGGDAAGVVGRAKGGGVAA